MSDRKPYKSDLSDERWALIEPVIAAWKADHPSPTGIRVGTKCGRLSTRSCSKAGPAASGTTSRTICRRSRPYYYFAAWRDNGTDVKINDLLRWQVREKAGRSEDPSLVVIDTQSVHAAVCVPAATTGKDAAKKVPGRKRGLAVDVLGLVIAVTVLAASAHDSAFGIALLGQVATIGTIKKALVDQGFKKTVVDHGTTVGIDVEIVERNPTDKDVGFVPQAKRWIVEQTLGILMLFRRLVRDYESRPKSSESRVRWAMIDVIARRLTGQTTPTWRG